MLTADQLYHSPNVLAEYYRQFRVAERLLLTGHSHQAWPDVALHGMEKCWQDAATHIDDKWERAFAVAGQVKASFATLLHDHSGYYALGQNSHELVVRFLSALALRQRPRLITTDSEFHSIRRQLDRLAEEGIEIVRVPSQPLATLVARLNEQVNSKTAAVLISSVFYDSGLICPPLTELMQRCEQNGVELLIDLYHQLNVVPFDVEVQGL
ncbi:MAG: kynureninase, partial [Halothiobacillaceae bacterium]